ncbi:MAG: PRC-barrel domain-containing protein [Parcubacteria group bacterium]
MTLSERELFSLPVETRSGVPIGSVVGIELDTATHRIIHYRVERGALVFKKIMLIAPIQVLSLTNEKMVVEDTMVKEASPIEREEEPDASAA